MRLLLFLLVMKWASGYAQVQLNRPKITDKDIFYKMSDDPFSDPVVDIPIIESVARHGPLWQTQAPFDPQMLPRDRYLKENNRMPSMEESKQRARLWIDYQQIHDRLIQEQALPGYMSTTPKRRLIVTQNNTIQDKMKNFEPFSFGLKMDNYLRRVKNVFKPIVWTTCDDLKQNVTRFIQEEIIDLDWTPFYTWSSYPKILTLVHKFQLPTKKTVFDYKMKLGKYINKTVKWDVPKLHLKINSVDMELLLISADRKGLYYIIEDQHIPEFVQRNKILMPLKTLRLKLVGEYLAMMFCDNDCATIMAREGHIPPTNKDKNEAARLLNFRGKGRPVKRDTALEKELINSWKIARREFANMMGYSTSPAPETRKRRRNRIKDLVRYSQDNFEVIPDRIPQLMY